MTSQTKPEIPEDVLQAARKAAASIGFLPYEERGALVSHFAKAILAERERCAAVADSQAQSCCGIEEYASGYYASDAIANEIRNPCPPIPPLLSSVDDDDLPF